MHRGQWKHANRLHLVFFQKLHGIGESRFPIHKRDHERPLILKDPAGHGLLLYALVFENWIGLVAMNRDMPRDGVRSLIVLSDPDPIEFDDAAQFIDKDVKKFS